MMRIAWRLVKSYWTSEEKWSAWRLIFAVLILNLGSVFVNFRHIMRRQKSLTCFTLGYTQAAAIFPWWSSHRATFGSKSVGVA